MTARRPAEAMPAREIAAPLQQVATATTEDRSAAPIILQKTAIGILHQVDCQLSGPRNSSLPSCRLSKQETHPPPSAILLERIILISAGCMPAAVANANTPRKASSCGSTASESTQTLGKTVRQLDLRALKTRWFLFNVDDEKLFRSAHSVNKLNI
jgi:hypothetical protein